MNNERFAVPELLFHPSDIGVQQMGISEAIVHVIGNFPPEAQFELYKNILLTGGSSCLPNFKERVEKDVRMMSPAECDVRISIASKYCDSTSVGLIFLTVLNLCVCVFFRPVSDAWQGGCLLTKDPQFSSKVVTRKEYEEHGFSLCQERFDV